MFQINAAEVGTVKVTTSQNRGFSSDQIADMATDKIVYVADNAPPAIQEQARVFADRVRNLLRGYVDLAKREERATIIQVIEQTGNKELANIIRRL